MKIGIFDSGIGGLTVLKELLKKYANNEYHYFGDNINIPYGTKSKEEILNLTRNIINFLKTKNVDILIIACGTISSNVYEELKKEVNIPIYDVVSPVIKYINNSNYNTVGLMATPMTVESRVFPKQINKDMICIPCPKLVPLIENNQYTDELYKELDEYLSNLKEVGAIILGCTHYPILSLYIKNKLPNIDIINMGTILSNSININNDSNINIYLYFSKIDDNLISNINNVLECKYNIENIVLE